jgi:hypothetical protein
MKRTLNTFTSSQLVQQFADIALAQYRALLGNDSAEFNILFGRMNFVVDELKSRSGDDRHLLASLYGHENPQVRLKAAVRTLGIRPQEAREVIERIASSKEYPQAGDAGMTLDALDRGIFKPD